MQIIQYMTKQLSKLDSDQIIYVYHVHVWCGLPVEQYEHAI